MSKPYKYHIKSFYNQKPSKIELLLIISLFTHFLVSRVISLIFKYLQHSYIINC